MFYRTLHRSGFTLLEVMVAIAILGLGLTTILSSQVGLFANSSHAGQLSVATGLVRCKMSEIEEKLLRDGYSVIDESDEGECCEDSDQNDFSCSWHIESVELPDPPTGDFMSPSNDETDPSESGGAMGPLAAGPLGALAQVEQSEGAILGGQANLGSISELMGGGAMGAAAMGGVGSMAPMVMGIVYPDLKGMLEASIRKITVQVLWKEGKRDRDLKVVQFVTNPTQGGLESAEKIDAVNAVTQTVLGNTGSSGTSISVASPGSTSK